MFRRVGPEVNDLAFRMRCHFPKINCFSLQKQQHAALRFEGRTDWWTETEEEDREIDGPDGVPVRRAEKDRDPEFPRAEKDRTPG